MLTYTFEDRGDMPYYEYLYTRIKNDILNGTLIAGEKLPSKRAFAAQLSVSVMTVENAYAQLMVEGYIYSEERKGYFVSDTSFLEKDPAWATGGEASSDRAFLGETDAGDTSVGNILFRDDFSGNASAGCESFRDGFSGNVPAGCKSFGDGFSGSIPAGCDFTGDDFSKNAPVGFDSARDNLTGSASIGGTGAGDLMIADFTSNTIRPENFPFSVWAKLMRRVLTESREELLLKPPAQGMPELRAAVADHLRRFRGMRTKPEQVVIGAGTEYLYSLLIQLLGRDKVYGVENPGYRKISRIYHSNGVMYRTVGLDENGINMDALRESGADIIHISPSHHFPTGIVTPISRRAELLAWACEQDDRYIIEDDYDCEFRFTGRPIPTMAGIDRHDRVIYMNTFSKSLTPSIRISYMVLPESLVGRFREELGFYSCTVSNFEQMTLAAFLSEGYFEKHINRLRNYYRGKRDCLTEALIRAFPKGEAWIDREDAGLHFLLHLKTNRSDAELKERALREGIRVSCLSDYYESGEEMGKPLSFFPDDADQRILKSREEEMGKPLSFFSDSHVNLENVKTVPNVILSGVSEEKEKSASGAGERGQHRRTRSGREQLHAEDCAEACKMDSQRERYTGTGVLVMNYSGISTDNIALIAEKMRRITK